MKLKLILSGVLAISIVAAADESLAAGLPVLADSPACTYERLGLVRGSSGRTRGEKRVNEVGAGGVDMWGERADPKKAFAALRKEAEKRGANAVVLRRRERSADTGGSAKRGDSGLTLVGLAIRTGAAIDAAECAAQYVDENE